MEKFDIRMVNKKTGKVMFSFEHLLSDSAKLGGRKMKIDEINQAIEKLGEGNKGGISDGSHTFDELYFHRMMLFAVICNSNKNIAWKSWKHDDGTMFDDYFIVGVETPQGQYTYHYQSDHWNLFNVKELEYAPKWDGHQASDVYRLFSILDNK